ncbi:MAG: type II toxin-antitoxin system HicA family toxin [Candidatus Sabulitectum sp.]|nr:type II toxin-antitoxin system HicA family toxin [Candidatus Sabulitectum sp.]
MTKPKLVVEKALRKKGFLEDSGDHHRFTYRTLSGKTSIIRTHTSHSKAKKEISIQLISRMARQVKLSRAEFLDLIDCHLSQEGYEDILRDKTLL